MQNLTLIIPAKEEAESLPNVLKEIENLNYPCTVKIVLKQNDKKTIKSVKKFNCKIIYQKNNGYGDALIEGINSVKTKYFCIFNADGSFYPIEIKLMLEKLKIKNKDFIFGTRYEKGGKSLDDTFVTYIGNFIFTKLGKILFNTGVTDILYTFVIGKTDKIKKLNLSENDFRFCVELPIKLTKARMKIINFPSFERKRIAGEKKVKAFKDGFLILKYMLYMFFKNERK